MNMPLDKMRNLAIIAHVDHGKTTLVDELLKQSGTFRENQDVEERAMDSNDLERERGITILAKCTSIDYKNDGEIHRLNIIDTPGHADFGGEVERILSMVDGVVLLVDAAEGPMPQTKFVTSKALKLGLKPIVVINKADRSDARVLEVYDEVFGLFVDLDANDEQLDFPVILASGRNGWAVDDLEADASKQTGDLGPLFKRIIEYFPCPTIVEERPEFSMLVTAIEANPFLGRILTGRIETGTVKVNQNIHAMSADGKILERGRVSKILAYRGLERVPLEEAHAGDIIAISGLSKTTVADTISDPIITEALVALPVDPPTLSVTFSINDSPLAGRDGKKVQSRIIRERLFAEMEGNVAIKITDSEQKDGFIVSGRGELQLGILIETMRREGFELSVSRPKVIMQKGENGERLEPIEEVVIDVDEEYSGSVIEKLSLRKGELVDMRQGAGGKTRIIMKVPARGLIGYHGQFLTDTRGTGVMNRVFDSFAPHKGEIEGRRNGVLISNGNGDTVPFALFNLEARGIMFITNGVKVYEGMIIGEHNRSNDLVVNCLRAKQLTNMRASGKDEAVKLTTPRAMSLEEAISYIETDELVEVTPNHIRLRKIHLNPTDRKRAPKDE
ncbi:MAG: translational GTPase TypA [Hyphomicrobiales bacterium]|nr:MAG: translational GTPase TypA [Hyphomicrobiales bacterium]